MDFGVIAFYLVLSVLTLCYYMNRVRNNRNRERKLRAEATKLWYQKILWKNDIRSRGQETAQPAMPKRWYSKIQRKLGIGSSGRSYCETASDFSIGPIFNAFFDGHPHNTEN